MHVFCLCHLDCLHMLPDLPSVEINNFIHDKILNEAVHNESHLQENPQDRNPIDKTCSGTWVYSSASIV